MIDTRRLTRYVGTIRLGRAEISYVLKIDTLHRTWSLSYIIEI